MRQTLTTAQGVKHALLWIMVTTLVIYVMFTTVLSAWLLYARFTQTNRNRVANARIWHAVICDIEEQIVRDNHTPNLTRENKARYIVFYDGLLVKDAHTAPCNIQLPPLPRR